MTILETVQVQLRAKYGTKRANEMIHHWREVEKLAHMEHMRRRKPVRSCA
jgi:hypothetical protein